MGSNLRWIVLALTVVVVWPGMALATDDSAKGAARELANEAKRDCDAGRFEEAGRKFQRAYEIAKVPTLAVWAARSLAKHGQLVAASELYREAMNLAPNDLWVGNAQQQAQADAGKELGELQPRIPQLRVRVEGAAANDVEVAVDDVKLANALYGIEMPTDPGQWRIVGKRGTTEIEQTVDLNEGERKEVVLRFLAIPVAPVADAAEPSLAAPTTDRQETGPAPASTPPVAGAAVVPAARPNELRTASKPAPSESAVASGGAQRTWGWVAVGIGAAGLITGAVTGILVLSNSGLRRDCQNGVCDPAKVDSSKVSTYNLMRNLSTAGLIVGGVGAAVGVTLLLWTPKRESEPRMALWLGPGSAGVKGAF